MKVYQCDANGFLIGETVADESPLEKGVFLIPANCTKKKPPKEKEGKIAQFADDKWKLVDIPKPVESLETEVADVVEDEPEIEGSEEAFLLAQLRDCDLRTLRPMRAIIAGTDTKEDHETLNAIESEISKTRDKLKALILEDDQL